jgi:hypothetical protein
MSMARTAIISPDGIYRYHLTRRWNAGPLLPFIMLNPSTADADIDDPTIRRCMGFAKRERASGIVVGNVYAFRATKPTDLWKAQDPHGPENDAALRRIAAESLLDGVPIVCAWGAHASNANRHIAILQAAGASLVCLGKTKHGAPRHPLYVKGNQPLESFR